MSLLHQAAADGRCQLCNNVRVSLKSHESRIKLHALVLGQLVIRQSSTCYKMLTTRSRLACQRLETSSACMRGFTCIYTNIHSYIDLENDHLE